MADNINVTPGTGKIVRAIEKSSNLTQVVVLDLGGAGAESLATGVLPVEETSKTLTVVSDVVATSGSNSVVATPGSGHRIVVTAFVMQNEAAAPNVMILEDGSTAAWRCLGQNQGDGLALVFPPGYFWRLVENHALTINLAESTSVGYSISYFVEDV